METSLGQPGEKERIEAKVTKEMKDLILKASLMKVRSTSDFVVASAFEAARETIRTRTTLELSVRDRDGRGQIDRGLDGALEVEDIDILLVDVIQAGRVEGGDIPDPF